MQGSAFATRVVIGGLLFAAAIIMILILPGLIDDMSSTVPLRSTQEAGR